jgi:hypothetical protein
VHACPGLDVGFSPTYASDIVFKATTLSISETEVTEVLYTHPGRQENVEFVKTVPGAPELSVGAFEGLVVFNLLHLQYLLP